MTARGTGRDMEVDRLGFVGFGEAAFHVARGLKGEGVSNIVAYDIHTNDPTKGPKITQRAHALGVTLVDSSATLAAAADVLISAVTADRAVAAATLIGPHLGTHHLYCDLNSISPKAKEKVAQAATVNGAAFCEIAVMGPIPPYGHKAPLLLGADGATRFEVLFAPLGMRMEIVSTEQVGRAAAVKMFRSIVYKGIEALLFECVLGAGQYGAEERVFASLAESIPGVDWKKLADYMVGRVVVHGERRAREMDEVARTLEELGIEPMMASATARRFDWAAQTGLREHFSGEFPATYQDVVQALASRKNDA
jgi:3-hydroxyisobutyrate dehydrogenase-like beta-hydroxyacid dehydrogenase